MTARDLTYQEMRKVYTQARTGYGKSIGPLPPAHRDINLPIAMQEFDAFVERERKQAVQKWIEENEWRIDK